MVTPQENRFARLAMEEGALSAEELAECLALKTQKEAQGSRVLLWDLAVMQELMEPALAEQLAEDAGDLEAERIGDFKVLKKLGEGGMGSVYLAVGPNRERAALKVLSTELARQRALVTRFLREGRAACKLQHPHLVRGIEVGEDSGHYYFAMEFVDGTNVHDMLRARGRLLAREATNLVLQIAEGLAYAHEHGFIHRDIKPGNVLVSKDGVAKLADLGLARQMDAERTALTRTGASLGTPTYVAPEQALDAKRADERSDIYALGATWYHMIAGRPPFEGDGVLEIMHKHLNETPKPVESFAPGTPRSVSQLLTRMLAKEPERRVQSAAELCDLIRRKCLRSRNIKEELGIANEAAPVQEQQQDGPLWDAKVKIGNRVEKRRLSMSEMRTRIDRGQITYDTPVRQADEGSDYRPASSFFSLQRELPATTPLPATQGTENEGGLDDTRYRTTSLHLHELMTHFDEERRAYQRRRKKGRWKPYIIEGALLALAIAFVWLLKRPLTELVRALLGSAGS